MLVLTGTTEAQGAATKRNYTQMNSASSALALSLPCSLGSTDIEQPCTNDVHSAWGCALLGDVIPLSFILSSILMLEGLRRALCDAIFCK